jgi:hypothetical protein
MASLARAFGTTPDPIPCPKEDCDSTVQTIEFWAGWEAEGWDGVQRGNYADEMPPIVFSSAIQEVRPCPEMDRYCVDPCGHRITREQASEIHATFRTRMAEQNLLKGPDEF